jgi:g-D-glutamyl-meso-diaminopimelate peptidase
VDRYTALSGALQKLKKDGLALTSIGRSVEGREIWAVSFGTGPRHILMTGAIHAREWIASDVLLELIRELAPGFHYANLSLAVVPMLNPDGVVVAETQTDREHKERQRSNARGVDLNRNFDAKWNTRGVHPEPDFVDANYPGEAPFSEPETVAVRDLVQRFNPELLVDWHFRGGLVDIEDGGPRAREVGELLARCLDYRLVEGLHYETSGTFAQWFRKDKPNRSLVTVELRHGEVERDWPEARRAALTLLEHLDA